MVCGVVVVVDGVVVVIVVPRRTVPGRGTTLSGVGRFPTNWFEEEEEESWHQLVDCGTSTRLLVVPTVEGREGQ